MVEIEMEVKTVQTFSRRVKLDHYRKFDLIIIDEAHRSASDGYLSILRRFDIPVIGFTATPYRTDSRTLREVFNHLITGVTVAQMIKDGYLVPTVVYAEKIDLSGVESKLDKLVNKSEVTIVDDENGRRYYEKKNNVTMELKNSRIYLKSRNVRS